jgi:osmotically-inducible protein OsmY
VADPTNSVVSPANDAHLVQLVRGALGRRPRPRGRPRINVSSCSFAVTLHGIASSTRERAEIEAAAREVPGVSDVANRLRLTGH